MLLEVEDFPDEVDDAGDATELDALEDIALDVKDEALLIELPE